MSMMNKMVQVQTISYIIINKDFSCIEKNNITPDYFEDTKDEFTYIKNHYDRYGVVPDKETFLFKFPDFDYVEVEEPIQYLIDELNNARRDRIQFEGLKKLVDLQKLGKLTDPIPLLQEFERKLSTTNSVSSIDILKDTSRYQDYVNKSQDFKKYYISTGLPELDQIIGGWDRNEELATIVARTNMGKTWWLLKFITSAIQQGLRVGLYSGEMTENKVGSRIDTLLSGISNKSITHGNIDIQNEYKRYIDDLPNRFGNAACKVLTPARAGGPVGVSALRTFIEKENLDMLCIDQHSLLEDDNNGKTPVERASNISRDLKNLQVMKRIPIISVSQQNRTKTEDKSVDTTQVAQSDRIAQDSTIILFFENKDGIGTLTLVKSRDSENGKKLTYMCDFDKGNFRYMPTETDANGGADCDAIKNEYDGDIGEEEVF